MTKEEALAKFNRISNDPRQAQAFVKDLLDGKLVQGGTKLYRHNLDITNCNIHDSAGQTISGQRVSFTLFSTISSQFTSKEVYGGEYLDVSNDLIISPVNIHSYDIIVVGQGPTTSVSYVTARFRSTFDAINLLTSESIITDTVTEL